MSLFLGHYSFLKPDFPLNSSFFPLISGDGLSVGRGGGNGEWVGSSGVEVGVGGRAGFSNNVSSNVLLEDSYLVPITGSGFLMDFLVFRVGPQQQFQDSRKNPSQCPFTQIYISPPRPPFIV